MSTTKDQIHTSLLHFGSLDASDTAPTSSYSLIGWDGSAIKVISFSDFATKGLTDQVIKCSGLQAVANVGTAFTGSTASEYGDAYSHVSVITTSSFTQDIASAALGFGKQIYTFPTGGIKVKRVKFQVTMAAPTETATGVIGLGSVVGAGAVSVLSGTAGFVDEVTGFANTAPSVTGGLTTSLQEATTGILDGTTTAKKVFLNFAATWTKTETLTIPSAIVTIFWDYLGAY